jgi:hypothetical protein
MIQKTQYYGDFDGQFVLGTFLYVFEDGDEQWPDEHVVLYDEFTGESHWIGFDQFFKDFRQATPLDVWMLVGYDI